MIEKLKGRSDFQIYFCKRTKRNYWMLGHWGGSNTSIIDKYKLAIDYANENNVEIESVKMAEVYKSRRFKSHMFMISDKKQQPANDAIEMENVASFFYD